MLSPIIHDVGVRSQHGFVWGGCGLWRHEAGREKLGTPGSKRLAGWATVHHVFGGLSTGRLHTRNDAHTYVVSATVQKTLRKDASLLYFEYDSPSWVACVQSETFGAQRSNQILCIFTGGPFFVEKRFLLLLVLLRKVKYLVEIQENKQRHWNT